MSERASRKRDGGLWQCSAIALVGIAFYFGGYYWLIDPDSVFDGKDFRIGPNYQVPNAAFGATRIFFMPAYWADLRIRHSYWDSWEFPPE